MRGCIHIMLLFMPLLAFGQDVHFSQFYSSPLTLNTAETGFFRQDYRVGANLKQQWPWAQEDKKYNYLTYSFFSDAALFEGKLLDKKDWIGIGGVFVNDYAGDGRLSVVKAGLNVAYHKVLAEGRFSISLGFGATYVQKYIDFEALYFDKQWSGLFFDLTAPTGEPQISESFGYFDFSTGISISGLIADRYGLSFGASFLHLNKPSESFFNYDNQLGIRPAFTLKGLIPISKNSHFEPSMLYMNQKNAQEIITNLLYAYRVKGDGTYNSTYLLVGVSYRVNDAMIPLLGLEYKRFRFLANYDINLSSLTTASQAIGGFEMSLVYTGYRRKSTRSVKIPCPSL